MSWIDTISSTIEKAFSSIRPALKLIPPIMLLCEIKNRPGLSAIALTTAVIRRLPEAGIETGVNPDGSPNKIGQFVRIFSEEVVKEIKNNAQVTTVVEPGSMVSSITGMSPVGPIVGTSVNTAVSAVMGIVQ